MLNAIFGWSQLLRTLDASFVMTSTLMMILLVNGYLRDSTGNLQVQGGAVIAAIAFWYAAARLLHARYGHGRRDAGRDPAVRVLIWLLLVGGIAAALWYAVRVASTVSL